MSKIKLTYFDFDGGRGETVRLVLSIAWIEFEDHRVNFEQFAELKPNMPLGSLPVLEINNAQYTQGNAMARYFGKQAGLYPEDAWQAFLCDEIIDMVEDIGNAIYKTMGLEEDAMLEARTKVVDGALTTGLKLLEKRLLAAGGSFITGDDFTIADLKVFEILNMLKSGRLDHIPTDLAEQVAPQISAYLERVNTYPGIKAYYEKRSH